MSTESTIFARFSNMSTESILFARFSKCRPKASFLRDVQYVDRKHNCCEILKMSTERTIVARFSKCRPNAQCLRDVQNVDRNHIFCEIFKMSSRSIIFARFSNCRPKPQFLRHFAMESDLSLRRGFRICGHCWVALARRPSSIFVGGLEKRLPFLDCSALLLQIDKTSRSTKDPGHENVEANSHKSQA